MGYITPTGHYRVGPFVPEGSIEVPDRPEGHMWNGTEWVPDPAFARAAVLKQIRAEEDAVRDDQARLLRAASIKTALDEACELRPDLTRDQVHAALMAQGKGYAQLVLLEARVAALRAQL